MRQVFNFRSRSSPILAGAMLLLSHQGVADINVVSPTGFEIHLTPEDQEEILEAPRTLIADLSEHLEAAIASGRANTIIYDNRGDASVEHPIVAFISYPVITVGDVRTVQPAVECKGTLYPIVWTSCTDRSEAYLELPEYGTVQIQPESITREEAESVLSELRPALQSIQEKTGEAVHRINLRYRKDSDLYEVWARTKGGAFSGYVRPNREVSPPEYEITELSVP